MWRTARTFIFLAGAIGLISSAARAEDAAPQMLTDSGGYQTENNWIAAKIGEEIAGMAWLAIHPDSPIRNLKVKATVDPQKGSVHLELTGWADKAVTADLTAAYAWDAKAYAPFARQLLGSQKAEEPVKDNSPNYATDLLTPTGEFLAKQDVDLSQSLLLNPVSIALHEKTALLLLVTAMRENADTLSDPRILMCRACAHLSLRDALQPGGTTSWVGKLADTALRSVAGREADALKLIDASTAEKDAPSFVPAWSQALTMFTKEDWRVASPDESSALLVKIVWAQIVARDLGDTLGANYYLRLGKVENVPDWGRALLSETATPAVGVGHVYCPSTISLEFHEIKTILAAEGETIAEKTPLSDVLKNPVGPSVGLGTNGQNSIHVIGSDLFKDIAERHIIAAAWKMHYWMRNSYGVPDEDAKFVEQMKTLFQGARHDQYLMLYLNAASAKSRPSTGAMRDDLAEIPPSFAFTLQWPPADAERLKSYFSWGIPFGSPFNLCPRWNVWMHALTPKTDSNAPTFTDLMPLKPDSYTLVSANVLLNHKLHVAMTEKDERAMFERFFDYNLNSLSYFRELSYEQHDFDPATIEKTLHKMTALDPDEYYNLAYYLQTHDRADEAADAYRKAAAQGNDQVEFANNMQWLVEYDWAHNQQDEAVAMAKKAADVFSATGIDTYIWVLCKQNKFDEAENMAQQEQERYGGGYLATFYAQHSDHFPDKLAAEVKKHFPDGMPTVTLANFTSAPTDGCVFQSETPELNRAGLHTGDVVVALDSHPVHSQDTYSFVRALSDAPEMDLIVWQKDKYVEVKASPPKRRFGNQIGDYHP